MDALGSIGPSDRHEVVAAGIDWVTLTSTSQDSHRAFSAYFNQVAGEDLRLGYKVVPGGAYGFYGERSRHALVGFKEDRIMLQVSGKAAKRALTLCAQGDNCTRIDVQVTVRLGGQNVSDWLSRQAVTAASTHSGRGKPAKVSEVRVQGRTETVYVGSRQSDVFVRLYDKFAESKDEAYRGCVRMEVEFKGKASKALWAHMAASTDGVMYLLQLLLSILERKGIDVASVDLERQAVAYPKQEPLKQYVSLGWLATQVAPTVARLVPDLSFFTVFHALFGRALTEHDFTVIMNAVSLSY